MRNLIVAVVLFVFVAVPLLVMKFGDDKKEQYLQGAYIGSGLVLSSVPKASVVEYYTMRGEMPADNKQANIPAPEQFADQAVKSVAIKDGTVVIKYNHLSGVEDGVVKLIPMPATNVQMMRWRCETPSYSFINEYAPQCNYVGF